MIHKPIPIDWEAERLSVQGRVTDSYNVYLKQLGTLKIGNQKLSYVIPSDGSDVDPLTQEKQYRLESVSCNKYGGEPQLRIDDSTSVTEL